MIETLRKRIVYENQYVTIRDDDVRFPDGSTGTYYFSEWKAPYGVAISCVYDGKILLLRNFRYAEQDYSLEIPQGFGSVGSTPLDDAKREFEEETGIQLERLVQIGVLGKRYPTYLFHCELDSEPEIDHSGHENTEDIDGYMMLPFAEVDLAQLAQIGVFEPVSLVAILQASSITR